MTQGGRHAVVGFTLIESIVLVIVIALAVPGLMMSVRVQTIGTIDHQRRIGAAWLASSVLETIEADAASDDGQLGFAHLDNAAYLNSPATGLYARLADVASAYEGLGLTYSVSIGSPIDLSGAPAGASDAYALREVTVAVTFTDQSGTARTATFRTIVSNT